MSDVIFVAVLVAFFVLCALYVQLCDHMIGPDEPDLTDPAIDGGSDLPEAANVLTGVTS